MNTERPRWELFTSCHLPSFVHAKPMASHGDQNLAFNNGRQPRESYFHKLLHSNRVSKYKYMKNLKSKSAYMKFTEYGNDFKLQLISKYHLSYSALTIVNRHMFTHRRVHSRKHRKIIKEKENFS
jgi:hypothetical protein